MNCFWSTISLIIRQHLFQHSRCQTQSKRCQIKRTSRFRISFKLLSNVFTRGFTYSIVSYRNKAFSFARTSTHFYLIYVASMLWSFNRNQNPNSHGQFRLFWQQCDRLNDTDHLQSVQLSRPIECGRSIAKPTKANESKVSSFSE